MSSVTSPNTLFYSIRNSASTWEPFQAEGTVFGSVNRGDVATALVPWPMDDVEAELSAIELRIASMLDENERLAELRDALLPELLSGRTNVPAKDSA